MGGVKNCHGGQHNQHLELCQPAYEGAKFDVTGHCLKHSHIRLCKPKETVKKSSKKNKGDHQPEIKYVIVRKTCHLCGEHGLRNERKFNKKSWSHGYVPPKLEKRKEIPSGMVGADVHIKMNTGHGVRTTKHSSHRGHRHIKVTPSSPPRGSTGTPPTSPESEAESPSRNIKFALTEPPPALPSGRESPRKTGERKRMIGAIPAGPNYFLHRSAHGGQNKRNSDGPHETASDDGATSGSRTTRTEKRSNVSRRRSKSMPRSQLSMLKKLDHLRV